MALNEKSKTESSARLHLTKALLKALFIFLSYYLLAYFSLEFATLASSVSPVWPATGLSIAMIYLFGYRFLPAIFLASFLVTSKNVPLNSALIMAAGNTLEPALACLVLNFIMAKKNLIGYFQNSIAYLTASFTGALVSSTVGVSSLLFFKQISPDITKQIYSTWFIGNFIGGIIFLPLLVALYSYFQDKSDPFKIVKPVFILQLLAGLFLSYIMFVLPNGAPLLFLVFPYLLWCSHFNRDIGTSTATFLLSVCGIMSVKAGYGIFLHGDVNTNFLNLQLFLASAGISSLILSDLKRAIAFKKPSVVLISCWLIAAIVFTAYYYRSLEESQSNFESIVSSIEETANDKINEYFSALENGSSLFAASDHVTREEWASFVNHTKPYNELPGMQWLGIVFAVTEEKLPAFLKAQKKLYPKFTYHQLLDLTSEDAEASKQHKYSYVITFIEPLADNFESIGLDLAREPDRRKTMEMSRDTGLPHITRQIPLLSVKKPIYAFLAFYPFYRGGSIPKTIEERRKLIIGWVYSPISVKAYFNSVFQKGLLNKLSYSIFDSELSPDQPIFKSADFDSLTSKAIPKTFRIGNHSFNFQIKRNLTFYEGQDNFNSWSGAVISIISILLGTFIISLQATRGVAIKLAEKKNDQLKASEELLKFALEGSGDSVWDWNVIDNLVRFDGTFSKMLGYPPGETLTKATYDQWHESIHPDDRKNAKEQLDKTITEAAEYNSEYRIRCKSGAYKWFLSRGMIVEHDANGKPRRMVGTITDISERKKAERAIESERAKLHSIFEGTSDAILLFSSNNVFIDCNITALKMFNVSTKTEMALLFPFNLTSNLDSSNRGEAELKKAFTDGRNHFEWPFLKRNGDSFTGEVVLDAFEYDGKKIIQAAIRDMSERKYYEISLRKQREMLVASAKMSSLGELAGGIAHEINNPLSIVIAKTTQIKRQLKTGNLEKAHEDLNLVESTARRIASIIKGLKAFSRNAEKDEMQEVLVPALIKDILELSKERFKFNLIDLRFRQHVTDEVYVNCRTAQLLQVLVNLINNAFDAVEHLKEKWVEIELSAENGICKVSVTDSGNGIDPKIVEKIMSPFFTTKPVDRGTGLGLSISKTIIEEHNGKLYYDSNSAHTRFVIELPVVDHVHQQLQYH